MRGSEGFSGQVCDPVPKLVMTRRDKATPLEIEGVTDFEFGVAAVAVIGGVWGL